MMVSCLDCHEEIWLNADGSGKARIEVSIPTQAARIHGGQSGVEKQVAEYLKETPEFRSYDVSVSTKKDRLHIRIAVSFDNAMDLSQTTTGASFEKLPAAARDLAGHADVRFKGLKILYHRRIDLTRAIPGSAWIPHDQLKHHAIETVLHLPVAAAHGKSHNGEKKQRGDHGNLGGRPRDNHSDRRRPGGQPRRSGSTRPHLSAPGSSRGSPYAAGTDRGQRRSCPACWTAPLRRHLRDHER